MIPQPSSHRFFTKPPHEKKTPTKDSSSSLTQKTKPPSTVFSSKTASLSTTLFPDSPELSASTTSRNYSSSRKSYINLAVKVLLLGLSPCMARLRWEIGNGLWNRMVLKGCKPNLHTFNVRIQFLITVRRAWDANALMGLMQRVGVKPDEVTLVLEIVCGKIGFRM